MLNISNNFLQAIIEATPNAIYVKDEQGRYLMINEQGAKSVGLTVQDFIGKTDLEIFPEELANRVMKLDRRVLNGHHHSGEEKVNDDLYFQSNKFAVKDEKSGKKAIVGISTDITELKKSEQKLQEAREKAEEASSHKSIFLQNMSHELRTPLNAIIGFSSILCGESGIKPEIVDDNFIEYAKLINSSGIHLLAIINDLLDLSKIEAGEQEFTESEIDVKYVIETCVHSMSGLARERNIRIYEKLLPQIITMKGDERIMRQMISNLLSNAIKYSTEDNDVQIILSLRNSGGIDISIIDDGIGMTSDDLRTAMIPFRRASQVKNSEIAGTGLGLPLVDAFIKLFQGTLDIKSEIGVGTSATLHFPPERSVLIRALNTA
ncbi:MAG: PAS domain-containing protein [Kordiimonadaceae bacterium]|nr:PAS domain-containing protein [Kordiimonadaceae bacterium]